MSFTFDGVTSDSLFDGLQMMFSPPQGRAFISPEITDVDYVGGDGARFVSLRIPKRVITQPFTILGYCSDPQLTLQRKLMGLLRSEPKILQFPDQTGHYEAVISAVDVGDETPTYATGSISFLCENPYLLGEGRTVDWEDSLSVDTNWLTPPVITLIPSSSVENIAVTVNGKTLTVDHEADQGATIIIDSQRKEVHVGGTLIALEVDGEWPMLQAVNTLTKTVPGTATIAYAERWL